MSPEVEYDKFFTLNCLSKSKLIGVFKLTVPLISLKDWYLNQTKMIFF